MSIRKAFSLTELLIVLVILGVLFTAALPVVTKRKVTDYLNDYVWNYVYADEQKDAYYHPGDDLSDKPATAFVGTEGVSDNNVHGKLTIRAGLKSKLEGNKSGNPETVQRHIQFRYGPNMGTFAGTLYADEYNMLLGARYDNLLDSDYITNYSNDEQPYNKYNTIMGINTGDNIDYLTKSVLIGNGSLTAIHQSAADEEDQLKNGIIAIGNNVYTNDRATKLSPNNIFIGHNSGGIGYKEENSDNVVIGYNALPYRDEFSHNHNTIYQNNVFLGANTGGYFTPEDYTTPSQQDISRNVIIGSEFLSNDASDNVIIGHGAYESGDPDIKYLTAIGNGACNSVESIDQDVEPYATYYTQTLRDEHKEAKFPRTCIGVGSASEVNERGVGDLNIIGNREGKGAYPQGDERIYIGSILTEKTGSGGFGGRAPLEIHNVPEAGAYAYKHSQNLRPGGNQRVTLRAWASGFASDASVVLNSHLVVRGLFIQEVTAPYERIILGDAAGINSIISPNGRSLQAPIHFRLPISRDRETVASEQNCKFYTHIIEDMPRFKCGIALKPLSYSASSNAILYRKDDLSAAIDAPHNQGPYKYLHAALGFATNLPDLSSDRRLKTDITENNDGLEKILALEPFNYIYKSDLLEKPQVGVIAQDLQKVFPHAVSADKDGFLKIRWEDIFYAMINSVKTLASRLEKIATSISDMEVSVITVKDQHKVLKKEIAQLNARAARLERK